MDFQTDCPKHLRWVSTVYMMNEMDIEGSGIEGDGYCIILNREDEQLGSDTYDCIGEVVVSENHCPRGSFGLNG